MKDYLLAEIFDKPISGEWGNEISERQEGVKVIRTTNFTNKGVIDLKDVVTRDIDIYRYASKLLKKGDIIIEKSGGSPNQPVGRTVLFEGIEEACFCNNFTAILRPLNVFNPKYILYMLMNLYNQRTVLKYQNKTTGIINLKLNDYLAGTKVSIPNKEIQNKVANVLDKAQELIDKRKEQIEACDELIKSLFYHMFGDPVANTKELPLLKLGELCKMKAGKGIKACDIFDSFAEGMHPCYGGNGIRGYVKDYTHEGCIPLVGRQGALCGNVKYAMGKFYATEHAIVLQSKFEVNTYWLYIMLREMNLNRLASGAAQPGLNVSTLVPLDVIFPPIQLQNKFAQKVEKIEQQKQLLEQSLTELENNFNSLMQRAFKGELF